jgi:hypothetical protein
MNTSANNPGGRSNRKRYFLVLFLLIVVIGGALIFLRVKRPRGPKLLNQPTKAREVRPLTEKPDPRFAPLPIEREKHGK